MRSVDADRLACNRHRSIKCTHLALGLRVIKANGMLHPALVIPVWEVLPSMRPSGFLSLLCAVDGDGGICQQVLQLECLQIMWRKHTTVGPRSKFAETLHSKAQV